MANLKDIRKRIRSVKNTQKITSAMKMVAAAKLKRAQDAITAARPYGIKLNEVVSSLAALVEPDAHPLLRPGKAGGVAVLVVLTSSRGLCGAFNASLIREVEAFRKFHASVYDAIELIIVGKKGQDYYKRRAPEGTMYYPDLVASGVKFSHAKELAELVVGGFDEGRYDHVFLAYNEFKSAINQEQQVDKLLPIEATDLAAGGEDMAGDTIFEPDQDSLLEVLLPKYIETQIHRGMLDSAASEQGSRMTAMDNATNNAKDMIKDLTLQYNRARQAAITRELVEITSGAEALHG